MTEPEGFGRRLARYRKRLGFSRARELANATGGRVSEAVLMNIESGRKQDVTVTQLLELASALGISPLLLLAPLETPTALLDLPGLSGRLASMTSADFDAWARGTDTIKAGRTAALLLRGTINQIRTLHRELDNWQRTEQARRRSEHLDTTTHERAAYTDQHAITQQRREARIDRLYNDLADHANLNWAHRPWRN